MTAPTTAPMRPALDRPVACPSQVGSESASPAQRHRHDEGAGGRAPGSGPGDDTGHQTDDQRPENPMVSLPAELRGIHNPLPSAVEARRLPSCQSAALGGAGNQILT